MRFTSIDVSAIEFGSYEKRAVSITPHKFQIPRMYMPFGVSGFTPAYGATKYNIDFSMKGWNEEGHYVKRFYDFLKQVEDLAIDRVLEMCQEIFGKSMTRNELLDCFNSNIKPANGPYDPKFRVKVDNNTTVYNVNDEVIPGEIGEGLYKGFTGAARIEIGNIYFFNKKFGIVWKIVQIKVYEPQRLHGFAMLDGAGMEDEEEDGGPADSLAGKGCQIVI